MDAELRRAVTGLEESRARLREESLAPLRARRGDVPAADEHQLLGTIAALVESVQELTEAARERRTTPDTGLALTNASRGLAGAADLLRGAERRARENA